MPGAEPDALVAAILRQQPLQKLLKGGAHPTVRDQAGLTAFHHAVLAGNVDAVEALLDHACKRTRPLRKPNGDPSQAIGSPWHLATAQGPPPSRPSPLHLAAERSEHLLRHILGHSSLTSVGASFLGITFSSKPQPELLQLRDGCGWSLLHYAVSRSNLTTLRFLIHQMSSGAVDGYSSNSSRGSSSTASGAPFSDIGGGSAAAGINAPDNAGRTALHQAALLGHAECCRLLLKAGADQSIPTFPPEGALPLHLAASGNHVAVIDVLFRHAVAQQGFRSAQTVLLRPNAAGLTALHVAALQDSVDAARRLLHLVFPFDTRGPLGRTALHLAALKGSTAMIAMLLGHSTQQQRQLHDAEGFTPVHLAAAAGRLDASRALVAGGCSVDVRAAEAPGAPEGCAGWTPLHCAVRRGDLATIELLLGDLGADPYARDEAGRTACDLAVAVAGCGGGSIPGSSGPGAARSGHVGLDDMLWGPLQDGNGAAVEEGASGSGSAGQARLGSAALGGSTTGIAVDPLQGPTVVMDADGPLGMGGGGRLDEAQVLAVLQAFIHLLHDPLRQRSALLPSGQAACGDGQGLSASGSSGTTTGTFRGGVAHGSRAMVRLEALNLPALGIAGLGVRASAGHPAAGEAGGGGPHTGADHAAAVRVAPLGTGGAAHTPSHQHALNGPSSRRPNPSDSAAAPGAAAASAGVPLPPPQPANDPQESRAGDTGAPSMSLAYAAQMLAGPTATPTRASPFSKVGAQRASPFQVPAKPKAAAAATAIEGGGPAVLGVATAVQQPVQVPATATAATPESQGSVGVVAATEIQQPAALAAAPGTVGATRRSPFVATTRPSPFAARPSRLSHIPPLLPEQHEQQGVLQPPEVEIAAEVAAAATEPQAAPRSPVAEETAIATPSGHQQLPLAVQHTPAMAVSAGTSAAAVSPAAAAQPIAIATADGPDTAVAAAISQDLSPFVAAIAARGAAAGNSSTLPAAPASDYCLAVLSPINSPCGYSALNRAILLQKHALAEALMATLPPEGHNGCVVVLSHSAAPAAGAAQRGTVVLYRGLHVAAAALCTRLSMGLELTPSQSKGLSPLPSQQQPLPPATSSGGGEVAEGIFKAGQAGPPRQASRLPSVGAALPPLWPSGRPHTPPRQRQQQQQQQQQPNHHSHLQHPPRPPSLRQPSAVLSGIDSLHLTLSPDSTHGASSAPPPPLWPLHGPGVLLHAPGAPPPSGSVLIPGLLVWDEAGDAYRTQPPSHTTRSWLHWPEDVDPVTGWLLVELTVVEVGAPGGHVWLGLGPTPDALPAASANMTSSASSGNLSHAATAAPIIPSTAATASVSTVSGLPFAAGGSVSTAVARTMAPGGTSLMPAAATPVGRVPSGAHGHGQGLILVSPCPVINHPCTYVVCVRDGQAFRGGVLAPDLGAATRLEAKSGDTVALFWNRRGRNAAFTLNGRYCGRLTSLPPHKRLTPIVGLQCAGFIFKWRCCSTSTSTSGARGSVGSGGGNNGGAGGDGGSGDIGLRTKGVGDGGGGLEGVGVNVDSLMVREQMLHEDPETPWLCKPSMTSLHFAAWSGNTRVLSALVRAKGFPPDEPDGDGWTPLHFAALAGQLEGVRELQERGAHPDLKTKCGSTPVLLAAKYGRSPDHVAIVRVLADAGAALDVRDGRGRTLLMFAAKAGNLSMVQLLLERGLDPSATDCQDREAQQFAGQHGAIFRLLRNAQAAQRAGKRKTKQQRQAQGQGQQHRVSGKGDDQPQHRGSRTDAGEGAAGGDAAGDADECEDGDEGEDEDGDDPGHPHGRDVDVQQLPSLAERWRVGAGQLVRGRLIEQGAFGAVFEGTWCGARVAIKQVLRRRTGSAGSAGGVGGGGGDDGGAAEREVASLKREVAILAALPPHERIARMLGSVELPGEGMCLVMAYYPHTLQGVMQSERLRRSWLTPLRRAAIARQLAEGLAFLHGLPGPRVIHRDLKPNNVLLEAAPSLGVKICDFGLSRIVAGNDVQSSSAAGHAFWMAPELLRAQPYDEKVDVYSYGVILYQLACWVDDQLYGGLNKAQVDFQVVHGMLRLQDRLPPGIDPGVQALVRDCLDEDPRVRPTMAQALERLAGYRELSQPGHVSQQQQQQLGVGAVEALPAGGPMV